LDLVKITIHLRFF